MPRRMPATHHYIDIAAAQWGSQWPVEDLWAAHLSLSARALGLMDHLMRMRTTQAGISILGRAGPPERKDDRLRGREPRR